MQESIVSRLNAAAEIDRTERERVGVSLVALGHQERMLVLEALASGTVSPAVIQALMSNAEALVEGARSGGRLGYKRAAEASLAFPLSLRGAYFLYRRFGVRRFFADQLGERFEMLLVTCLLTQRLASDAAKRTRSIFGERIEALIDRMLKDRLDQTQSEVDALRRQYPDYLGALESRILLHSASHRENGAVQGSVRASLIPSESTGI
jgi:monovalent cation:H+ antiporter, CPA1 family